MYISGITVEKKKGTLKLNSNLKLLPREQKLEELEDRPYSSEHQLLEIQNHYSVGPLKRNHEVTRHLSQNKISIKKPSKKNISTKAIDQTEVKKEKDNYALTLKPKLNKRPASDITNATTTRLNPEQMLKITQYFRYMPVSILSSIGLKDDFMRTLSQLQDFKTLNPYKKSSTKKQISEYWVKLNKQAQLKGKYKYRQKYNYLYSPQLKALDYKKRQYKKKKEESSSSEDDDDKMEKCRDMETWKKSMGIDGKVFIIKGKYPDLKQALLQRGWVENNDKKSTFYDLRWTTKISDINFAILKPNQMVNHFDNNACLTSKYGLIKSIRSVMYPESMDIDRFFPKAYDLSDLGDFQNFLQIFKWIHCQSLLKLSLNSTNEIPIHKLKLAILITQRRLVSLESMLKSASSSHYPFCSINEWNFLNDKAYDEEQIQKTINSISGNNLQGVVKDVLHRLGQNQPQFFLNGFRNIWIVKPAFLSRGRGIKCLDSLNDILDTCLGKETQYVVQKYIQNPLIINKRKFDIRIWVVVEDYNPPKIWFYNQFYLRFCLQDYNTDVLKNRYSHLTNNSVQKYNNKIGAADLDSSMWDRQTFEKYITENYGESKFKTMLGKMKEIIIATILGTIDQVHGRKGSFQQMGYDMMIDENLNPWLIEVNSSPAMDYSTPITRKLVKMVMQDIVKIIVDLRKKKNKTKNAGEFKLIYSGVEVFKNKYYRITEQDKNNE